MTHVPTEARTAEVASGRKLRALTLGSLGVVYGDIGTSPLYAFREALLASIGGERGVIDAESVLGVLSLILWALMIVVTAKYVLILLRVHNRGEGGTLALMALAQRALGRPSTIVVILGIIGAALFYGDALITPAISVLSAIEGLKIATPMLEHYAVPLTIIILIALFFAQSRGTARIAVFFGPIMGLWFIAIAMAGLSQIAQNPGVLAAFNPLHAIAFLGSHGYIGLVTLGAVFLAVTGAEALYADLGHFGRKPIQIAWLWFVLPALAINYFGQGALVLADFLSHRKPILSNGAFLGPAAHDRACHSSDGDREPGSHHRCLLDHEPSRAARALTAVLHSTHLGNAGWANLPGAGQWIAACRRRISRPGVRLIQ